MEGYEHASVGHVTFAELLLLMSTLKTTLSLTAYLSYDCFQSCVRRT